MRALMMVLISVLCIFGVDAKGYGGAKLPPSETLFSTENPPIVVREHSSPLAPDIVFRYGRQFWPLTRFGDCFVELKSPEKTVRVTDPRGGRQWIYVSWKNESYLARCWHPRRGSSSWMFQWEKIIKTEPRDK